MASSGTVVVLVHGAFADGSSFARVVPELQSDGIDVRVPGLPMRTLLEDADYLSSFVSEIARPVLLVGHSYGCAVTTIAGLQDNVVGLVYLSGYALEEGESLGELQQGFADSHLPAGLVFGNYPSAGSTKTEASIEPSMFRDIVAADVDEELVGILAVSQRPLGTAAFEEKATGAAWKTKPCWASVSIMDHTINPDVQRFGYKRAGIEAVEIDSSHMVILSQPAAVVDLIRSALAQVATKG